MGTQAPRGHRRRARVPPLRRDLPNRSLIVHAGMVQSVERWVPGIRAARTYQRGWLRPDLVSGLVLAAILVPQGMAYAQLAGLPPVTGLYTTVVCLLAYAVF